MFEQIREDLFHLASMLRLLGAGLLKDLCKGWQL
jgi:hypothetical protein